LLGAVENGLSHLPRLSLGKPKPTNKVIEERWKKAENDEKQKVSERLKLDERKKMLKEQLDKMKVEKVQKDKVEEEKKKARGLKDEEKKKRNHDKLLEDM